jgi:four helix bundle protein
MKDEGGSLEDLRTRTKRFGLAAVSLYVKLPIRPHAQVMSRQMLRSATSVGAHYREACRARSDAEFISKMEGGLQELDETAYWLELLIESGTYAGADARDLHREAEELIRILVTIVRRRKGE